MEENHLRKFHKEGPIEDSEIALTMAKEEQSLRSSGKNITREGMDMAIDIVGLRKRFDLEISDVANKIRESLSPEEISTIKEIERRNDNIYREILLSRIVEK